jgi:small subunit ribosomal protein S2e
MVTSPRTPRQSDTLPNTARLVDDVGPWNDFEVVDGSNKDDVVGIRKISDGPNGAIFTPLDFEK